MLLHCIIQIGASFFLQNKAQLVVIAHDVDPIELVVWLPALCRNGGSILHRQGKSTPWIGIILFYILYFLVYVKMLIKITTLQIIGFRLFTRRPHLFYA